MSALHDAVRGDDLARARASVMEVLDGGASFGALDGPGRTALFYAVSNANFPMLQLYGNAADINISYIWVLFERMPFGQEKDPQRQDAWSALLRIAVLRSAPPARLVARMSLDHASMVKEGACLRARLPEYLAARQDFLDDLPPLAGLPAVLLALVYSFEGPITAEECWATGLGVAPQQDDHHGLDDAEGFAQLHLLPHALLPPTAAAAPQRLRSCCDIS